MANRERVERHRRRQGRAPLYAPQAEDPRVLLTAAIRRFLRNPHVDEVHAVCDAARDEFADELPDILHMLTVYSKDWHADNDCVFGPEWHELRVNYIRATK